MEISSDWIWEVDKDWNFTYLSSRIENVLGYSPQELVGRRVKDIMYRQPTNKTPGFQESIAIHKDGHPVYLESRGFRVYNDDHSLKGFSGVGRDITERKQFEEVLKLNEVRTQALLDITRMSHLPVSDIAAFAVEKSIELTRNKLGFIGMCNENESLLNILAWNKESLQHCKKTAKTPVFKINDGGLWAEPIRQHRSVVYNNMQEDSIPPSKGLPEDHVEIKRFLGVPVFDGERVVLVVAVANKEMDYNDSDLRQLSLFGDGAWKTLRHRRDQQALAADQKLLSVTLQSIADGVVTTDLEGKVLLLNPVAQAITGWKQEEAGGMSICELLPDFERKVENAERDDRGSGQDPAREYQITFTTRDGTRKLLSISRAAMYDDDGNSMGSVFVLREITERNKTEARLMLSQKMESIGQLAAGIAHEINTPMQYIGDNMNFLKEGLDGWMQYLKAVDDLLQQINDTDEYSGALEQMKQKAEEIDLDYLRQEIPLAISQSIEGIQHVNRLVSAMKKFSHPGDKEKNLNNLNQAIEGTVVISRNEWKYAAELHTDLDPNLPPVYCLIDEINQVPCPYERFVEALGAANDQYW